MNIPENTIETLDQPPAQRRVLHVPLLDGEFRALKIAAMDNGSDMGRLTADALRATYNLSTSKDR